MNRSRNAIVFQRIAERFPRLVQTSIQGMKFGVVGAAATMTHVVAFIAWVRVGGISPLLANVLAFCTAVIVGFGGHYYWTFRDHRTGEKGRWKGVFPRFVVVSLIGLGLNTLNVYLVVNVLSLSYLYAAVVMATAVPAFIFVLSRFWAFS